MAFATVMSSCGGSDENPLLSDFNTPFDTPPFDRIELEHYQPAFEAAIREARAEMDAIVADPAAPTFENTIVALERSGSRLTAIEGIFFNLLEAETSDRMQEIALQVQPLLTEFANDMSLNPALFARVKAVYDSRADLPLDAEQQMLLEKTYKSFARNGANLSEEDKEKYRALSGELSQLTIRFGQNVLSATNAFTVHIAPEDSARVAELPEFVRESMAEEAAARGEQGWTVTLQAPSMVPFMTYSTDRTLKEQLWRAYNTRAFGGEFDNSDIVRRIAELRLGVANLLGYDTYADYVLEERMAESSTAVNEFLEGLLRSTREYALDDYRTIRDYAVRSGLYGPDFEFMPWDWAYFNEKYKNEKYSLNEEQIKPYLRLENVKKGVFLLAEKLYGLTFKENKEIPVFNQEVETYEVYDGDRLMAILYLDFFPRESKRGGAWMTNFREMSTDADGREIRPLVSLTTNFTKPTATTPSLLTFDEFETFLHEFGHCLHGILAEGKYASVTGTNVYRDFVELPSQIMENFATEREFLDLWAVHYQTGEKMPQELIDKIIAAKNYLAAYSNVRQLSFGIDDMAWHSLAEPYTGDVESFEKRATASAQVLPAIDGTCFSTSFSHIFAGGYAAGYYSYKWAEVLEADAFSLFREKGIFNPEVAAGFRKLLSKGGSEHPMKLYVEFRGHKPDVEALLTKMGLEKK